MEKKVEILSPAGSYESLIAAIAAGADAVYIGGTRFGARAYADNLTEEKMLEAIDFVHLHGRKIYLTVNTLLKEHELKQELYDYLLPYYKHGIDAVIVQDIGVLQYIRQQFPDLPIHASTQMTITDVTGAKFLRQFGVERIVTSREMNIEEIKEISRETDLEIESFVHGALCYCYSGQCLYSSLIGGRSGNRGQCAQPCRLPYKMKGSRETQYILSLKDMCTLENIPELIEAGIYSFKIEGRMKKPEYVAGVTTMYRKYVDLYLQKGKNGFRVDPKDKEKLMDLYNRGGSHSGYYFLKNGREMVSLNRPNHAGVPALKVMKSSGKSVTAKTIVDINPGDVIELPDGNENYTFANGVRKGQMISFNTHKKQVFVKDAVLNRTRNESLVKEIRETINQAKKKEKIKGKLILSKEQSAKLILSYGAIMVEVYGEPAQEALNQPMDAARIEKQMRKTGNTEFEFDTLQVELDGALFIPMQNLNELRRNGINALEAAILNSYRRNLPEKQAYRYTEIGYNTITNTSLYVYVEEVSQLEIVLGFDSVKRVYIDINALKQLWSNPKAEQIIREVHQSGKEIYLGLPHIIRKNTREILDRYFDDIVKQGWDGFLIRNNESYEILREHKFAGKIVTDYSMYQFNRYAKGFWLNENVESGTAPLELNYKELMEAGMKNNELVVYGHLPMMISAQCIMKTTRGCKKQRDMIVFVDRYHKEFAVKNHCDYCYNVIYNTAPLMLADQKQEIQELAPKALRLHFTIESKEKVKEVLKIYEDVFINGKDSEIQIEFTRGHFKRGIK